MQLHDILLLRTSAILPEAISAGGLTPTTDTSLFLTTYKGGSHLPADIIIVTYIKIIFQFNNIRLSTSGKYNDTSCHPAGGFLV